MSDDKLAKNPDKNVVIQDPVESHAIITTIPKDREFVIKRPGNINVANERGAYAGCRLIEFGNSNTAQRAFGLEAEDLAKFVEQCTKEGLDSLASNSEYANVYFKYRANLLVVNVTIDIHGNVFMLVSNHLEDEELEEFQEYQHALAMHMREWKEARATEQKKLADEEAKIQAQAKELLEIGKKAKEHNLFGKLKELEAEVKELRSALNKKKAK